MLSCILCCGYRLLGDRSRQSQYDGWGFEHEIFIKDCKRLLQTSEERSVNRDQVLSSLNDVHVQIHEACWILLWSYIFLCHTEYHLKDILKSFAMILY